MIAFPSATVESAAVDLLQGPQLMPLASLVEGSFGTFACFLGWKAPQTMGYLVDPGQHFPSGRKGLG
jgi:hypothetical protein